MKILLLIILNIVDWKIYENNIVLIVAYIKSKYQLQKKNKNIAQVVWLISVYIAY